MHESQQHKLSGAPEHTSERSVLVIGISARAFVESAVRSNYSVTALDAFGDEDLRMLAPGYSLPRDFNLPYSPGALFDASRQLSFDAVAYTSNLENHPDILRRFEAAHRIAGNAAAAVEAVRDWRTLFSSLRAAGFCVPETIVGYDGYSPASGRWLTKPVRSGGGHGILFFQGQSPREETLLQEYLPGKVCSASFVANGSESVLLGITEQLIGDQRFGVQGFRYCGNILPLPETYDRGDINGIVGTVRQISEFLVCKFGLSGINGFDFILNHGEVYLIEVNPRYSASMELIERAYNLPIFHIHMEACLNQRLPDFDLESQLSSEYFFGKSILFSEIDSVNPGDLNLPGCDLRDIPGPGQLLRKGSPICTILANGKTWAGTYGELIRQAGLLKDWIYG
jgi:uncharacterized protein